MGDGNSFPLVVCVFQVILAYESIVLCTVCVQVTCYWISAFGGLRAIASHRIASHPIPPSPPTKKKIPGHIGILESPAAIIWE